MKKKYFAAAIAAMMISVANAQGLKDVMKDKFLVGTALNTWQIGGNKDMKILELVDEHFSSIVAEDCMKSENLQPLEGEFRFGDADKFVNWGIEHNKFVVGHCLVWHSQAPGWFFSAPWGKKMTRELMIQRMKEHIYTVVGHFRGRVKGWDVVNEAIEGDGTLRKSPFLNIIGEDFIELAFKFAHEADPDAELYYNDYGMDGEKKRNRVVKLIRDLKAAGCRIDAVGMQSHVAFDTDLSEYEKSLKAFAAEGVKVSVTELDLSVLPWPEQGMGAAVEQNYAYNEKLNPYRNGLPKEKAKEFNDFMTKLFDIYLRNSDSMERVTFWGMLDSDSWKNNWPVTGRTDYPLAFDRNYEPKPFVKDLIKKLKK